MTSGRATGTSIICPVLRAPSFPPSPPTVPLTLQVFPHPHPLQDEEFVPSTLVGAAKVHPFHLTL